MPIFSKNFIKIYLVDRQIIAEKNKQMDGCNDRQIRWKNTETDRIRNIEMKRREMEEEQNNANDYCKKGSNTNKIHVL